MLLSRSQFIGLSKRRFKNVPIPDGIELPDGETTKGMEVRIRSLSEKESADFDMSNLRFTKGGREVLVNQTGMEQHRRRLLRMVVVDEQGNLLLTAEDDAAVMDLDGLIAQTVYTEACKHCGMKERDEEPVKN